MTEPRDAASRLEELLARRDATASHDFAGPEHENAESDPGQDAPDRKEPEATLPDAPLFALLRTIEGEVGVDRIDAIWVFPPRRLELGETAVVVVAAYPELDQTRRRVYAAHYTVPAQAGPPRLALQEFGLAPADRVGRVVEDVVERLKDEPAAAPQAFRIEADDQRWNQLLHDLAERFLAEAAHHPRLQRQLPRRR